MSESGEILIVEDSLVQAVVLENVLARHGYRVSVAENGRKALDLLRGRKEKPALVISDIMMPEMDGYTLCREIKADERLKDIPVMLLTSLSDPHDVLRGLECGADNFVTKPFEEEYLVSRIKSVLVNRELRQSNNIRMGVELSFAGRSYFIAAEQQQVLNLLLSTYEAAMQKNKELHKAQEDLRELNESLERKVEERTAKLRAEIAERRRGEEERTQLLEREQAARAEAEAANRAKDEFLSILSHELRTPLTSIVGWIALLRTREFDPETIARALETIERNARLQTQIVDDLLDVSRIITGKLRLEISPVNFASVVESAVESVRPAAESKAIRIKTESEPSVGQVAGDASRLQQVVRNLLSNAVKFTPEGGEIEISLENSGDRVRLKVKDTGCGIPREFLPYVFDRFRQADSSNTRSYGGLGLGLAIVRQLVELHGGSVKVESDGEGHGAIFTVALRRWVERGARENHRESYPSAFQSKKSGLLLDCPQELKHARVLLVDDDGDTLELLSVLLKQCGAETLGVTSAAEAISEIERWQPHVLISDIGMPNEDGYELIRQVRALPIERGGRIPAVALTAYAREEDRRRALLSGFQAHVVKPAGLDEFIATVAGLTAHAATV